MHTRRLFVYAPLGESRALYCPRHAAPSLLIRIMRQLSLALARAEHRDPLHCRNSRSRRRQAAGIGPAPVRLSVVTAQGYRQQPRRLSPHPGLSAAPARFGAGPARVAVRPG